MWLYPENESLPGPRNKSSLIYSVSDKPGALFETLRIFAQSGINIVKLESRPIHSRPWEYLFYVDLETDVTEEGHSPILAELMEKTEFFKFLGSYNKGAQACRVSDDREAGSESVSSWEF